MSRRPRRQLSRYCVNLLVDPDSTWLNYPKVAGRIVFREPIKQRVNEDPYSGEKIVWAAKYYQAWGFFRGIPKHIGKVQIEGHQDAAF